MPLGNTDGSCHLSCQNVRFLKVPQLWCRFVELNKCTIVLYANHPHKYILIIVIQVLQFVMLIYVLNGNSVSHLNKFGPDQWCLKE